MAGTCPSCGTATRSVPATTIRSLVNESELPSLAAPDGFEFCPSPTCDLVYHRPSDGARLRKPHIRVPVYQKEADPARLICYCFDHRLDAVLRDGAAGRATIRDDVVEKCRQGLDRCEEMNPQGLCCVGNIQAAMRSHAAAREESNA